MTPTLRHVHSQRIERWLGTEKVEMLSRNFRDWYGPPVNLRDVPGSVWVTKGGEFVGHFDRGFFGSAVDAFGDYLKRFDRELSLLSRRAQFGAGFASISDALAKASSGYDQMLNGGQIQKTGPTGVVGSASTLWRVGAQPATGGTSSAAPGGSPRTDADNGAMKFTNPSTGTLHLTGADMSASVINNALMLYDRLFDVTKTMNSTATEAVTGVPTRYQNVTPNQPDSVGGNFLFMEVGGTALAATGHNHTTCQYTDDAGNATQTLPSVTGISGAIVDRFDMPVNTWFAPLAAGDIGIKALSQMQTSAAVATGVLNFVIGHPIGVMTFPIIPALLPFDWLTNRRQAPRIFDDACLALFELPKPSTGATTYNGSIYACNAP